MFQIQLLPVIVCLAGFAVQFIAVSHLYFKYQTQTEVVVSVASILTVPRLSVCWRYVDILDIRRLKKNRGIHVRLPLVGSKPVSDFQSKLVVKDIFEYSPTSDEIYEKCLIRHPGTYFVNRFTKEQCRNNFNISRYYHREFICYKFKPGLFDTQFSINEYAYAPEYFNMMFSIIFNRQVLKESDYFTAYVHDKDTVDLLDSGQSRMWLRVYKNLHLAEESISLSYSTVQTVKLPPPYDTRCMESIDSASSKVKIEFECIDKKTVKLMNKTLFSNINMDENSTARIMTVEDLKNSTIASQLKEIKKSCTLEYDSCNLSFTYSKAYLIPEQELTVSLYVPSDPIITIRHVSRMILVEYLVYLSTCFGTWFGISIFAFLTNSSKLGMRVWNRTANRVIPLEDVNGKKNGTFKLIKVTAYQPEPELLTSRDTTIVNEMLKYLNRFSHELRQDLQKDVSAAEKRLFNQLQSPQLFRLHKVLDHQSRIASSAHHHQ